MKFRAMLVTLAAAAALLGGGCAVPVDGADDEDLPELVDESSEPLLAEQDPSVSVTGAATAGMPQRVRPPDAMNPDPGGVLLGCDPEPEPWHGGKKTGGGDKDGKGHD